MTPERAQLSTALMDSEVPIGTAGVMQVTPAVTNVQATPLPLLTPVGPPPSDSRLRPLTRIVTSESEDDDDDEPAPPAYRGTPTPVRRQGLSSTQGIIGGPAAAFGPRQTRSGTTLSAGVLSASPRHAHQHQAAMMEVEDELSRINTLLGAQSAPGRVQFSPYTQGLMDRTDAALAESRRIMAERGIRRPAPATTSELLDTFGEELQDMETRLLRRRR